MRALLCLFFLILLPPACQAAQEGDSLVFDVRSVLRTAKAYAKEDNYSKVDETLSQAFNSYPQALADPRLVRMEMDAQWQLSLSENKKIFLNSKPDTAAYFTRLLATAQYALRLDSLDNVPDDKGHVKPRYQKETGERLRACRRKLPSAGRYYYKRGDYATAWTFLDLYLLTLHNPLLAGGKEDEGPAPDTVALARLATVSAFSAGKYAESLRYAEVAEGDTAVLCQLLEMQARAHEQLGQGEARLQTIRRGHDRFPAHDYFALALIHHYDSAACYPQALAVIERTLEAGGDRRQYAFLCGRIYEATGVLDSAEISYQEAIEAAPEDALARSAAGMLALRRATLLRDALTPAQLSSSDMKARLADYYTRAAEQLEKARELAPSQSEFWRDGLREAYFRLNRGADLQALETP